MCVNLIVMEEHLYTIALTFIQPVVLRVTYPLDSGTVPKARRKYISELKERIYMIVTMIRES